MSSPNLSVPVNDELVLDAGTCELVTDGPTARKLVRPPATSMFEQLISYLESKSEPRSSRLTGVDQDTLVGTTLCVRWGSYLAVLMDGTKPLWSHANDPAVSAITDEEMARINIEVSAAFERCLDL